MFQDGFNLFPSYTWEPFEKIIHPSTTFEVLEERPHGYARAVKNQLPLTLPGTCSTPGHLFHSSIDLMMC